ncbi:N-acetyl-1-D-myo-inositol-2-amino-2-deoxy-alpha-D-glucopyranoside deacetylase [Egibacter rhizosphaerae]|uniref:N-acetyl-1-D-myo-inositol-2-amino-2-deoxy-alpha-D-glucopyranoside deacetylase n=1 Tax=Egibacter rhizosphaerae TaxID=1670831 RepID=A0A411YLK2_9ACTN|nr:N-acetyl-1-D-myo-inositol-2-amino-2-deoxy-alpha-D-glucopyranoside deacetylase [Egibacter rhizosphaerae]QBI22096.1 N-acetyl-1-D-myo-inositol-2-amino-2-deoxy-alpha-D-glucopyranoside deacetylase [Egibacter rhizosphaerae]
MLTPAAAGLLCVHAHPDDEVIGTGGAIAAAADRGLRVGVVTCTGGEEGEIVGAGMDPDEIRPRLAAVRREELAASLDILGAQGPRLLGYRDSGMMGEPSNDAPDCFWQANVDEAVRRVVREIRAFQPSVLVTYDAFGGYGHPDHIQAHRVTLLASEAAAMAALYPEEGSPWRTPKLYLTTIPRSQIARLNGLLTERGLPSPFGETTEPDEIPMGAPDEWVTTSLDVRPWLDRKWAALRTHRTQISEDSFFLNMPEDLRDQGFATEWYIRHWSDVAAALPEDDLFAGIP